jgi:iron complex transport system permease protein
MALGVRFGDQPVSLAAAWGAPDSLDRSILLSLRLPRVVLGALVGAALASSGAVLQALLQNPLADPFVLGVSGGAALGGATALALGLDRLPQLLGPHVGALGALADGLLGLSPVAGAAFAGALGATAVVFGAGRVGGRLSPYAALLSGVIFNAVASAGITFIKTLTPPDRLGAMLYWLAGALGYPSWSALSGLAAILAFAFALMWRDAAALNLLSFGDDEAASLGVDTAVVRRRLFLGSSLCVAAAVALSGLIGFVGLLVPHLLRVVVGPDQRMLLPLSALGGAFFLVLADLGARLLFSTLGTEAPVGVLTALLGGPVFLWLLQRRGAV